MDVPKIEQLLGIIGCERIKPSHSWVNATCPFASTRHSKGVDRHPSFGVSIQPGGESNVWCHTCGCRGNLHEFVWKLARLRGYGAWYDRACRLVIKDNPDEKTILALPESSQGSVRERIARAEYGWLEREPEPVKAAIPSLDTIEYPILPEEHLASFRELPEAALRYLTGPRRRLTQTTIDVFELGWQPQRRRVVIPMRDIDGNLVAITGRALDHYQDGKWVHEQEPKFMHSKGFRRDYFLFGEHLADRSDEAILVEGHFDVMYLRQMGYPSTLGVMGSHLSLVQVAKLVKFWKRVVILPDGDDAGAAAAEKWAHALKGHLPVAVCDIVPGKDPDDYEQEQLDTMFTFDNLNFG